MADLPDFNALSAFMRATGNGFENAATEVAKMQNIPVINFADQLSRVEQTLLRILRDLGQNVAELRQNVAELRQDFIRADGNNFARLMNAKVTSDNTALMHLLGPDNAAIPNFPATNAQIRLMNDTAVNNLLIAFGLPVDGTIDDRRNRFRQHIGLTVL
ncbi:hypothetical protein DFP73DRAFT_551512 [Morchella snyderi]|nr:hypothetical protein DFP73DRAFT_551512 [Morchella snyderi]